MKIRDEQEKAWLAELTRGNLRDAYSIYKKLYSISGLVVRGQQLGRTLGFPTANLKLTDQSEPVLANGVYAAKVIIEGGLLNGMVNIGFRPTIGESELTIEINIFDFSTDIYGEVLKIYFIDRIRDERKFAGVDALKAQLSRDKLAAEEILVRWNHLDSDTI